MIKGGIGGGNTITGLNFEKSSDINTLLNNTHGYSVKEGIIFYEGKEVARSYKKHALYTFLAEKGIDYKTVISKKLLPDEALYVVINNTLYIIEVKFQEVAGSVDEKLQTCDFKKKQYKKLFAPLNIEVEYIYILSDWFRKPEYKDVLDYIISVQCQYYFEYLPLHKLGLPVPETK
jgi:hypothetical protein